MGKKYTVGTQIPEWKSGMSQSLTFIVTEDCNLRCKYCYITHKSSNKRMSFETAKKFIDYVLNENIKYQDAVVLDFIGGEPLLEIELIDKICDYFKIETYKKNNQWFWNYRINICTNGVNYSDDRIQKFLNKNYGKVSLSITIDGIKEKHDLQRVFPDGSGSYDIVKKNVDIWKKQFFPNTKVTFSSEDLKYLKESIISLWEEGITSVSANVVFEDVWKEGDDVIYENQLKQLADYIVENDLYNLYDCSLFDDSIGEPYDEEMLKMTSCGAGKMIAVGPEGKLYPCMRYNGYSLNERDEYIIGTVDDGIDFDKIRPFETVTYKLQSDEECLKCPVASGCSFCQGFNYDVADTQTNFQRAKYICKMHKARVRANNYYFSKLNFFKGIERQNWNNEYKKMNIILSDNYVTCCPISNQSANKNYIHMDLGTIKSSIEYARQNFYKPIFIHSDKEFLNENCEIFSEYDSLHIVPAENYDSIKNLAKQYLLVFNEGNVDLKCDYTKNCIFNIEGKSISNLYKCVKILLSKSDRININILNLEKDFDFETYQDELARIKDLLIDYYTIETQIKEINLLTDILYLSKLEPCGAGDNAITVAPNGKFYVCPAFYSENEENSIGDLYNGLNNKNSHLYTKDYKPLCQKCDSYQCVSCVYHNKIHTMEVNIPSAYQCRKSFIEREISMSFQKALVDYNGFNHILEELSYTDPIEQFTEGIVNSVGFYKNKF
ncbi:MAG: radical SAM peptide maturase, CXXX-repeat target family [Lachnotalea sp.]